MRDLQGAKSSHSTGVSRRALLGTVAGVAAASKLQSAEVRPSGADQRRDRALQIRHEAADREWEIPPPEHTTNGDEELYPNKIANYSKGMPHNQVGEVDLNAYGTLLSALATGQHADFENVIMGCPDPDLQRKFVNPQSGLAFDMEGTDSHQFAIPPAPAFSSAEEAGEMTELYWMALLRDVPFTEYGADPMAQAAARDLSRLSDFRGPKVRGRVTPDTLFRGFTGGDLVGPYISQFLLKPIPFGAQSIDQRMRTVAPAVDYMTEYDEWLNIQQGCQPERGNVFERVHCYIRNGRDLAEWVHQDVLFQAYFNACLILLAPPAASEEIGGIGAALNAGNPYNQSRTQTGFGTFGPPYIASELAEVGPRALRAVWYQKWFVHRRLRPEAFGGRVHNRLTRPRLNYPIHSDVLDSTALSQVRQRFGGYLLPQAYPEGCPLHPSYGAGHATVAGACVTILKALFDQDFPIPDPVVPAPDGLSLVPYGGPRLTVGGELNKLAANIAMARNFAGIHWRSDYAQSLRLGEQVAIGVLRDQRLTYNEDFGGFTFTNFDGTETITV
jgi:hypothetical protein